MSKAAAASTEVRSFRAILEEDCLILAPEPTAALVLVPLRRRARGWSLFHRRDFRMVQVTTHSILAHPIRSIRTTSSPSETDHRCIDYWIPVPLIPNIAFNSMGWVPHRQRLIFYLNSTNMYALLFYITMVNALINCSYSKISGNLFFFVSYVC
jgi:hypothetical protein